MATTTPHEPDDEGRKGWLTGPWILALGLVLITLIGAGYLVYTKLAPAAEPTNPGTPVPPAVSTGNSTPPVTVGSVSPTPTGASPATGECGTPNRQAKGDRLGTAPDTKWIAVAGQLVPTTAGGPTRSDGYPHCFSPDTIGAITAAANYYALLAGDSAAAKGVRDGAFDPPMPPEAKANWDRTERTVRIRGFKVLQPITGERAELALLVGVTQDGSYNEFGVASSLKWSGQDWKVVTGNNSDPGTAGYVGWEAH